MRAARSRAGTDILLGWLAAVPNLERNVLSACSHSRAGKKPLLTERRAEASTGISIFAVRDGESPGCFISVIDELPVHDYPTPWSLLYVQNNEAQKKLLREASVMERVKTPATSTYVRHEYLQHAGMDWREEQRTWYQRYLVPENHELPAAIAFA